MKKISPANLGFTLIEVLIALTIMSIIALMTWRGISSISNAQQSTQKYTDDVLLINTSLSQWRNDLNSILIWPKMTASSSNNNSNNKEENKIYDSIPQSISWNSRVFKITRSGNVADKNNPDNLLPAIYIAAWAIENNKLVRWQSAPFTTVLEWKNAWAIASQPSIWKNQPANIGSSVDTISLSSWQIQYYRQNAWTNALSNLSNNQTTSNISQESINAANAANNSSGTSNSNNQFTSLENTDLPDGIRIILTLSGEQSLAKDITLDWSRPNLAAAR